MMTIEEDEQIDRFLDGSATEDEIAAFQQWLLDPENLERYARRAELHSDLRKVLKRRDIQSQATEFDASPVALAATDVDQVDSNSTTKRLVIAATVLATAVGLLVAVGLVGRGSKLPTATIVSDIEAVLVKGGKPWTQRTLPEGAYRLQEGLIHLRFGNDVMVFVEAPAQFDTIGDDRVVLRSGRLSANVPPSGIGFTVETPEAEVVDYGTEFSVDVEGGSSEVHVFDGLVRVHPDNQRGNRTVELKASQAVRINGSSPEPVDIQIANDRFIRDFEEPKRNYARSVRRLSPIAYYRMAIRDLGLASDPPEFSGEVLSGEGARPPHARGVLTGGSMRVLANSTGRGGRVNSPPQLNTGSFSLAVFVYAETPFTGGIVATNREGEAGNFSLSLDSNGAPRAGIRDSEDKWVFVNSPETLATKQWRHLVMTADGDALRLYEEGQLVNAAPCNMLTSGVLSPIWFGTAASGDNLWNGRIDELALFDRALSESEVADLYRTASDEILRIENQ